MEHPPFELSCSEDVEPRNSELEVVLLLFTPNTVDESGPVENASDPCPDDGR